MSADNTPSGQQNNIFTFGALTGLLLVAAVGMFFAADQVGVRYGLVITAVWLFMGGFVCFVGFLYFALFILPAEIDNWYTEGLSLLQQHAFGQTARGRGDPPDDLPPSIHNLGAGVVDSHTVLALGRGGSFSRAAGPGYVKLAPGEHIRHVIDLRHQQRKQKVEAMTRDGIPFETEITVVFRVRRLPPESSPPNEPYPYDKDAIFEVSYFSTVAEGEFEIPWTERIAPITADEFVAELSDYFLDDVYTTPDGGPPIVPPGRDETPSMRTGRVEQAVHDRVQERLNEKGVEIVSISLGQLTLPDDVIEQRIANWQAAWQRQAKDQKHRAEAIAGRYLEAARAEAEVQLLEQIVNSIESIRGEEEADLSDVVTLMTIEVLEKAADDDELARHSHVMGTLGQVQQLLGRPPSPPALPPPPPGEEAWFDE